MSDYAKKKNDELSALCKERGLAHNGKKADLVKRLEEHDAAASSTTAAKAKETNEDEIDWDEEPATNTTATTSAPANSAAIAAGGTTTVSNPLAVPNQVQGEDMTSGTGLTVNPPATDAVEDGAAPAKDYSSGISEATLDAEIEKRKARARRFGMPEDTEEIKLLERAKRFGTTDVPGLLNQALSSERKRGPPEGDAGTRKKSKGKPASSAAPAKAQPQPTKGKANPKSKEEGGYPSWMTAEDRERAEKRKAKWTSTA